MAMSIPKPFIHVSDSNGNPFVGAILHVYLPGTTTYADIFSDDGLSVSLPNPLSGANASDAAGNFPRFFIAAGTYRLRCTTSAAVEIFDEDDVDTGLPAGTGALPISRGGTGATTAAAARAALDVPSNSELSDLAADVSEVSTALQGIVVTPQGYLTLTSLTPVIASDVSAGTSVYYTPFVGGLVPIYDGAQYIPTLFTELTMAMNANHVASTLYDFFVINDSGTTRLVTGPAWNTSTAGAGSRGSGAGTTEIERVNGLWVNKNAMTARYGATTVAVLARQGTYVGTMVVDGSNGQISQHVSWGASRKPGPWNAYNRKPRILKAGDATASWTYATTSIRASNNAATNSLITLCGLAEEVHKFKFSQFITGAASNGDQTIGIGFDSVAAMSGRQGKVIAGATGWTGHFVQEAEYIAPPSIGQHLITSLELAVTGTATYRGTEANMVLSAEWGA